MRSLTFGVLATLAFGSASVSQAADLDYGVLRGPDYEPPVQIVDWSGFYIGAYGSYASAGLTQTNALQSTLADYFRNRDIEAQFQVSKLIALPASRASGTTFGAFAGYNMQFDEVVVGVEADYTYFDGTATATSAIARQVTTEEGIIEAVFLSGKSSTTIEDYGSVRARAGYAVGSFLPFVTGGFAVGRVTFSDTVKVQNYGYDGRAYAANQAGASDPSYRPVYVYRHGYDSFDQNNPGAGVPSAPVTLSAANRSKTVGGAAFGAGLEYAITSNILLRGEYQYVLFQDFNGHKAELNSVRGGAAVKF